MVQSSEILSGMIVDKYCFSRRDNTAPNIRGINTTCGQCEDCRD